MTHDVGRKRLLSYEIQELSLCFLRLTTYVILIAVNHPPLQGGLFSVTLSVAVSFRRRLPCYSQGILLCGVRTFLIPIARDAVARPAP